MDRSCKQCGSAFQIIPADLAFYEKISPVFNDKKELIPPPTLCPDCRFMRRLAFRNERRLYRRACDASGMSIVSMFPPESPYTVYSNEAWWGDGWDGLDFGRAFDFSSSFFEQFKELSRAVPQVGLLNPKAENSPYCNFADANKNCHMVINSNYNESSYFSTILLNSVQCADCIWVLFGELCFECTDLEKCYNVRFSRDSGNCSDSLYLYQCRGCSQCIGCVNLRNKKLHILNRPVSQKEYDEKLRELQTWSGIQKFRTEFEAFRITQPHPASVHLSCENVQGEHLSRCRNMRQSFEAYDCQDCAYCDIVANLKDCFDGNSVDGAELSLENTSLMGTHHSFTAFCRDSSDLLYCWNCHACNDLFGCVGLKHKKFCILNKQYSKEEYEKLVPKIIEHMKNDGGGALNHSLRSGSGQAMNRGEASGSWGLYFPPSLSSFGYNESLAHEYLPLTEKEAHEQGYYWRKIEEKKPVVSKTIPADRLPDSIDGIPDDVVDWAIVCEKSKRPFRILKQELDFYKRQKLPLPRLHPDERYDRRLALRNPRRLWNRNCMKCQKGMETTYSPERPEIVYCEECYLKEVY